MPSWLLAHIEQMTLRDSNGGVAANRSSLLSSFNSRPTRRLRILVLESWPFQMSETFVWVDYSCIPQKHQRLQQLAVMSLPLYASRASAFMVVAPAAAHKQTKEVLNFDSYLSRCWCRAELYSHAVYRGASDLMYCIQDSGLEAIDEAALKTGFRVFDGSLTCCRLKHKDMEKCDRELLMLPMLGVYASFLKSAKCGPCGSSSLFENMDIAHTFPTHARVEMEEGAEQRVLFGNFIDKLHRQMEIYEHTVVCPTKAASAVDVSSVSNVAPGEQAVAKDTPLRTAIEVEDADAKPCAPRQSRQAFDLRDSQIMVSKQPACSRGRACSSCR